MAKQTFTSGQTLLASQMTTLQTNDYNMTVTTGTANYTLVAGDVGQRRVQNMASAGTVTVPNATFSAGDALWIHSIGAGTQSIVAGAGLTLNSSAGTAPTLAQWEGGVVYFTSSSSAIFFRAGGTTYGVATGGSSASRTISGQAYTVLTFASDDNLVVSKAGLFDVLLVGGGGGGGAANQSYASGGGGAGALVGFATTTTIYLDAGTYAVDVGAGGAGSYQGAGFASYIGSVISAAGGGPGGNGQDYTAVGEATRAFNTPGRNGGSGGGCGGGAGATQIGQSMDETFGNDGGSSSTSTNGGGGGGYSAVGGNGATTTGGSGGNGVDVASWGTVASGTDNIAAGGGGGGSVTGGTAGTGGVAGVTTATGNAATTAGSGGGGGFTSGAGTGGAGAAGKVWVRFKV